MTSIFLLKNWLDDNLKIKIHLKMTSKKLEDDLKKNAMEEYLKKNAMEDDLKKMQWKTTSK
jgi:hypothetical protein